MGEKSSFRLTVQERILLHLNEFSKYLDQIEVPFSLTQEGIAGSVGVVRSAIPRAMKKLILKNQVKETLAHVHGVSRRRKVYHLTTEGLIQANEIKDKLNNKKIDIINLENQTSTCYVKEVPNKLNEEISILKVILNLDANNCFDLNRYKQTEGQGKKVDRKSQSIYEPIKKFDKDGPSDIKTVKNFNELIEKNKTNLIEKMLDSKGGESKESDRFHFIDKAPKISYFVGRRIELEKIDSAIANKDCKIVLVFGIAGIGKTTLASRLLSQYQAKYNLFWYRCHEWDTLRNIVTSLSKFLENFNRSELKEYIESNQNIDMNEVGEILENELDGINSLIFFDDFHKINDQLIGLFTLIREMLERINGVNLLIFSRSFVPFYDRRDVLVKNLILEMELLGLNEMDSKQLLKNRKIKIDNFKQVYKITNGHPLSLELLEPDMDINEQKNIKLYLEEEVLSRLSLREKSLLKIASIFRYPVPAEGFFIYEKAQVTRETLTLISRKALIKETKEGFEVHDLIRDFFYSFLTPQEKKKNHRIVGQFYLTRLKMINDLLKKKISSDLFTKFLIKPSIKSNSLWSTGVEPLLEQRARSILEAQHHFLMATDYNKAAEVSVILSQELLNLSYVEELLANLNRIDLGNVRDEYIMDLNILKADALIVLGHQPEAQKLYQTSITIAEKEGNKTKLAELFRKLGLIKEKLNDYDSAIEYLNKSLDISEKIGDAKNISDAYGGLGDVYWKMLDYNKSNKFYSKCIKSAEEIKDIPHRAKTFLTMGIQCAKHGQFEESIKYYERCLDILEKGKGIDGINYANFYDNLGDHYLKTIFSYYIQSNES